VQLIPPTLTTKREGGGLSAFDSKNEATDRQVVKQGWLIKEGKTRKNWKRRWFVASTGCLAYYSSQQGAKTKGVVRLEVGSKVGEYPEHPTKRNCFTVSGPKRTFFHMCGRRGGDESLGACHPQMHSRLS